MTTPLRDGFDTPSATITAIDLAFPARGSDREILPPVDRIPADFAGKDIWDEFHSRWFYQGLPADLALTPREGIDPQQAWDHLRVIQGSYGPKHEHKMAALSWLSSRWFESYTL